ncbi:hypothetical protein [Nafulsella turpanensis]|uniref:hypothetical protein n=1 Tax=Nafulsella turpanensis TaxID=1265690 RepID=UPI000345B348|nr:hypothetical protein [Nafulsella turpanensis]
MSSENQQKEPSRKDKKNWLEWTVFGISVLMVVGVIGYLAYMTYHHQESPPDIKVQYRPDPTENSPNRYYVAVQNAGGLTAEGVMIELMLLDNGRTLESSQVQLPFLPKSATHESWVNFRTDPALADSVVYKVMSYKKP